MPKVSVVMPVYNGERYVSEAIESILAQSFQDFEFLIIDDCSIDATPDILTRYQQQDSRIKVLRQVRNSGVTAALNRGCEAAQGVYIARMDADDISLPDRLCCQVTFLEKHSEVGVLGTQIELMDDVGDLLPEARRYTSPALVHWNLYFRNGIAHPSIMMRRDLISRLGNYVNDNVYAEDYSLWVRASRLAQLTNLPDVLLLRRIWNESITSMKADKMRDSSIRIIQRAVSDLLDEVVSIDEAASLWNLTLKPQPRSVRELKSTADLILRIYAAHKETYASRYSDFRLVTQNAALKLLFLARHIFSSSVSQSIVITLSALRLSPEVFILAFMKRSSRYHMSLNRNDFHRK